ncbi:MAG TPA: hypothetical protein VIL30_25795 [Ramlibacter sp.]
MAVSGPAAPPPPTPRPVREQPPADRFCDLILNGGVASGVVYPWAIVELARHFRFRRIGGNSVGAMAAALAAAAEYGRCNGNPEALEPLRRVPLELASEERGDTLMLRLFQPAAGVRRMFASFVVAVRHLNAPRRVPLAGLLTIRDVLGVYGLARWLLLATLALLAPALLQVAHPVPWIALLAAAVLAFDALDAAASHRVRAIALAVLLGVLALAHLVASLVAGPLPLLALFGAPVAVLGLAYVFQLRGEFRALADNGWGLCSGKAQPGADGQAREQALVEWLHEGIQRSAGREQEDRPLTFADLWSAPRFGAATDPQAESISLEMFSTNVTLGRPVTWPLRDPNARLFFRRDEWERIFPAKLVAAAWNAAKPYAPASSGDPPATPERRETYREIPEGNLPIAIAARMSLSFPLLFSCVPVHAVDYEQPDKQRELRKCLLTDGGLCTNFPVHLFDSAHPQWPTFGMMLSRRISQHDTGPVWLPELHLQGRSDNWTRSVPGAAVGPEPGPLGGLFGLLFGMASSAVEWNDNLTSRLPHVRNRVLRLALRNGEGQLNIAMPGRLILQMADEYGTRGGLKLAERFVPARPGDCPLMWREHLYVRAINQLRALREHLRGYGVAVTARGFGRPLRDILRGAVSEQPLREKDHPGTPGAMLTEEQAKALQGAVDAVAALERSLENAEAKFGPYQPAPSTKLQLRPRI